jgi:UDP:flavonoid glycosyltransferase YjiC (YdhE family)
MVVAAESKASRRFLIAVFGSRGNVFPLLALGRALRQRGHHVVFATTERYRDAVTNAGLKYRVLRPDPLPPPGETLKDPSKGDSESGLRGVVFPRVDETFRDLLAAGAGVDVLIFPMFIFPGPMAAERLGAAWVEVHFTPGTLNSIYDPPYLPPVPWLYPLQRATSLVPRLFNPIARRAVRSWHQPLYDLRAREGFAADNGTPLLGGMRSPWLTLGLFSPLLGTPQKDWPRPNVVAGFPFYEEDEGAGSPDVSRFLDQGEPPIVAALGSIAAEDRHKFFSEAVIAAQQLGRRLILIAGPDADWLLGKELPASVLVTAYAPYSQVFPRCCALIISGSIGPLSHALRSGRPLFIVPAASKADQPDNALRVTRLGVARWLMLHKFDANRAVPELRPLLEDGSYRENALRVASQIREENGLKAACQILEDSLVTWIS